MLSTKLYQNDSPKIRANKDCNFELRIEIIDKEISMENKKTPLNETEELRREIKFIKKALLAFAFVIGGILVKVIEMAIV